MESMAVDICGEEPMPSELSATAQGHGLDLAPSKLAVRYISGGSSQMNDVGSIQASSLNGSSAQSGYNILV